MEIMEIMLNNGNVSKNAAFGSEALITGQRGAYLRADACKRKCSKAEDAQYS